MGHNVEASARLVGNCTACIQELNKALNGFSFEGSQWIKQLGEKVGKNRDVNERLIKEDTVPMTYYNSCGTIKKYMPKDTILIGEGANTMDIGRTIFTHSEPRRKLDAATFGTMGIGLAAIISAQTSHPELWAVAVMGDSAFGFSAMECETITRYQMGAVIFIINNNGIYSGT
jgi:2-hydroxyacyl-CoA lyase 1